MANDIDVEVIEASIRGNESSNSESYQVPTNTIRVYPKTTSHVPLRNMIWNFWINFLNNVKDNTFCLS